MNSRNPTFQGGNFQESSRALTVINVFSKHLKIKQQLICKICENSPLKKAIS